jgi:hypothetical protein
MCLGNISYFKAIPGYLFAIPGYQSFYNVQSDELCAKYCLNGEKCLNFDYSNNPMS